ncbi:hypothetical protein ACPCK5_17220 [Streptomyces pseudogriseolus]|uniref:hypothetical protein n=1 Tax=Streptomyces pseudogriseolus TaxID=36817 RepID=UPI003FA2A8D0
MTPTVLTHGQYLDVRPWIVVVYVAAAVARGRERVRQLAKRLCPGVLGGAGAGPRHGAGRR